MTHNASKIIVYLIAGISIFSMKCFSLQKEEAREWTVEILLYSGLPNPAYKLNLTEIEQFKRMIDEAEVKASPEKPALKSLMRKRKTTYRGIQLTEKAVDQDTIVRTIIVRDKGLAIAEQGEDIHSDEGSFFKLNNEEIENYLIKLAYEKNALIERDKQSISRAKKEMKELELQD